MAAHQLTLRSAPALFDPYRLALPEHVSRSASGELLGRGTGSSVEYQDHRGYFVGDDIRHIDWRAYARSDRLTLKTYRREITPAVDVIVDGSLSTASDDAKRDLTFAIAAGMHAVAGQSRASVRLLATGETPRPLASVAELEKLPLRREFNLMDALRRSPLARRRGVKIVVSDFLFPHEPAELAGTLGRDADRVVFVQVLSRFEASPESVGGIKLEDAETDERLDLVVDAETCRRYVQRLDNLRAELARQVGRFGGAFASVNPGMGARDILRELTRQRVIEAE